MRPRRREGLSELRERRRPGGEVPPYPSDLKVTYLGIEGSSPARCSARRSASTSPSSGSPRRTCAAASAARSSPAERRRTARAIEDIVSHNDWRPGAKRAVLLLGDEGLEGGGEVDAADIAAASKAIGVAKGGDVRVHTYFAKGGAATKVRKANEAEFARVAAETGGKAFDVGRHRKRLPGHARGGHLREQGAGGGGGGLQVLQGVHGAQGRRSGGGDRRSANGHVGFHCAPRARRGGRSSRSSCRSTPSTAAVRSSQGSRYPSRATLQEPHCLHPVAGRIGGIRFLSADDVRKCLSGELPDDHLTQYELRDVFFIAA